MFIALITSCSLSKDPAKKAERLVRANYRDCEKIVYVSVDTITLGDNLQYRIEQQERYVKNAESDVKMYRRLGAGYGKYIHGADSTLDMARKRLAALDSLKQSTLDIANTPAAYQVCVAYNHPNNLVWIQLTTDCTLLKMSKRREELFLNPGSDMPGYYEIYERFSVLH